MNREATIEKIRLELERGKESFKSAAVLLKESLFDESVSSAYYAMFHSAKALLLTINQEPSTHQGVITLLGLHFIKSRIIEEEYNDMLIEGKDDREDSDYDITRKFTETEAKERLQSAEKFVSRINQYLAENHYL